LNNAWHGAEAMHYFMLAQRQFYTGHAHDAMISAMRLKLYEDVLGADDVCSLIALTSFHAGYYEQTSNAFLKLETHDSVEASRRLGAHTQF
jgi:WD repeat-containing protein 35